MSPDDYKRAMPRVTYRSGVATAEATIERKSVSLAGNGLMSGRQDGDNFRRNLVTVTKAAIDDNGFGAEGLSATWACTRLIATLATLPLEVVRKQPDGTVEAATDHWAYRLLAESPNADQTALDFWDFEACSIELRGNGYAEKVAGTGNRIAALLPLHPAAVSVRRLSSGALAYRVSDGRRDRELAQDQVLHIRGPGGGLLGGASTLSVCRPAFVQAMAAEQASAGFFANGVRPAGAFQMDERLNGEQREELNVIMATRYQGAMNTGQPLVLDGGLKWQSITIDPVDAQLLESRKFGGEEICRVYGVPPAMVGYGDKASNWGTGKEVDVLGFLKFNLRGRAKRIEMACEKQLLTAADRAGGLRIKFNMEGFLRGDSDGRSIFYERMVRMGAMTRNEVRRLEGLPPVAGGDVITVQAQNVALGAATQGD